MESNLQLGSKPETLNQSYTCRVLKTTQSYLKQLKCLETIIPTNNILILKTILNLLCYSCTDDYINIKSVTQLPQVSVITTQRGHV